MGFLDKLAQGAANELNKTAQGFEKGYNRAQNMTDEQIKRKVQNGSYTQSERMGMIKAVRERHGLDD